MSNINELYRRAIDDAFLVGMGMVSSNCTASAATSQTLTADAIKVMMASAERLFSERVLSPLPVVGGFPSYGHGIGGMRIYRQPYHAYPTKQAKTHRKKRINKKWRKRYGMVPDLSADKRAIVVQGRDVYLTPVAYERFMAEV